MNRTKNEWKKKQLNEKINKLISEVNKAIN